MDDSISRRAMQEIVDRIGGMYPYRQIGNRESYSSYNEAWTDCINRVDAELNSLPSAQPEIIHCRDCKHHHYESKGIPYCDRIDYGYGWKDDDFCSRAERRTDNANVDT